MIDWSQKFKTSLYSVQFSKQTQGETSADLHTTAGITATGGAWDIFRLQSVGFGGRLGASFGHGGMSEVNGRAEIDWWARRETPKRKKNSAKRGFIGLATPVLCSSYADMSSGYGGSRTSAGNFRH